MNLCSVCLQAVGLKVPYPDMLKVIKFCDGCQDKRSSVDVLEVVAQLVVTRGGI